MNLIQLILGSSIALLFILYLLKFRSRSSDKIVILVGLILGLVFVIFPDLTSKIANIIGVGRGADLLLYLSIIGGLFLFLSLYLKIRQLQREITRFVREDSVKNPEKVAQEFQNRS